MTEGKYVYNVCFFARHDLHPDTCVYRADGMPDRAHLVPQQRIRQAGERRGWEPSKIGDATWDARVVVLACRHHHGLFDCKTIRLDEEQYPPSFREWAKEHGFFWSGHRDGWIAEYEPEAA